MYVYRELKGQIYEVGHYYLSNRNEYGYKTWDTPTPEQTHFHTETRWRTKEAAQAQTSYLNGGQPVPEIHKKQEIILQREKEELQAKLQAVPDIEPPTTHISDIEPTPGDPRKLVDILNEDLLPELYKKAEKIKKEIDPTEPIPIVDIDGEIIN